MIDIGLGQYLLVWAIRIAIVFFFLGAAVTKYVFKRGYIFSIVVGLVIAGLGFYFSPVFISKYLHLRGITSL